MNPTSCRFDGYDGEYIYIHTSQSGRMIDFIEANSRLCFEFERDVTFVRDPESACYQGFSYETVIGYGTIEELQGHQQKVVGLNHILEHYTGRHWEMSEEDVAEPRVWRISISSISGKRHH